MQREAWGRCIRPHRYWCTLYLIRAQSTGRLFVQHTFPKPRFGCQRRLNMPVLSQWTWWDGLMRTVLWGRSTCYTRNKTILELVCHKDAHLVSFLQHPVLGWGRGMNDKVNACALPARSTVLMFNVQCLWQAPWSPWQTLLAYSSLQTHNKCMHFLNKFKCPPTFFNFTHTRLLSPCCFSVFSSRPVYRCRHCHSEADQPHR